MQPLDLSVPGRAPAFGTSTSEDRDGGTLGAALDLLADSGSGEGGSEVVAFSDGRLYVTNAAKDRIHLVGAATGDLLGSV